MVRYFLLFFILVFSNTLSAQKPPIDSSIYGKWPAVGRGEISNDGKYVAYRVSNDQFGYGGDDYFILRSVHRNWKITVPSFSFTSDSRFAYFNGGGDTLCKVALGGEVVERIPEVVSYGLTRVGLIEWLIYRKKGPNGELFMQNMSTGAVMKYDDITDYQFSEDGKTLVLQSASSLNGNNVYDLKWDDFPDGHLVPIWRGERASEIHLDTHNHQLCFSTDQKIGEKTIKSYWYYKAGSDSATELTNDEELSSIQKDLQLGDIIMFSKNGDQLYFNLMGKPTDRPKPKLDAVPVEVWSYRDEKLQSSQMEELKDSSSKSYLAVVNIGDHRIIRLQKGGEEYINGSLFLGGVDEDEFAVTQYITDRDPAEVAWNPSEGGAYMVSAKDGARKPINRLKDGKVLCCDVSPEGRYIIYHKMDERNYFSYSTRSGKIINITQAVPVISDRYFDRPSNYHLPEFLIIGWFAGDSALLLWDQYDIWEVDLAGNKSPVNLTNGYGRKHNISLQLSWLYLRPVVRWNEQVLLSAFNQDTKENGFYRLTVGQRGDPELVTMGPYFYNYPNNNQEIEGEAPVKARDAQAWLVKRMSAKESANYFWTSDFKTFVPISDVHPERDWNWVTTELINWKTPDGSMSQGVLYKPENFDPGKKYPIIFYYYERLSDRLNTCLQPGLSVGQLNILWYVSNGYLVFTPDIYYKIGEMGESALNYVESAARHLAKMLWVDSSRMGLQGLSYGGMETNYIVTHSHLFAAACSASGVADFISEYGVLDQFGRSLQSYFEIGQLRMGATLWQRPDLYIKNSAVFKADAMTTPLLLMHTAHDGLFAVANIKEFFIALRRLRKPVWMLLYCGDGDNHGVTGSSSVDFTIRMQQFFDHYLKGAPMPRWMVEGIPASRKGIDDGLELERLGSK